MRLIVDKDTFLKGWFLAERSAGDSRSVGTPHAILCSAEGDDILLQATDLKTSVTCRVSGQQIEEPGVSLLPVKILGEIFRKISSKNIQIETKEGKATLSSDAGRYNFSTFDAASFPRVVKSDSAAFLCSLETEGLERTLRQGGLAASPNEEFPQYLGGVCFDFKNDGAFFVVTTDSRRLAIARRSSAGDLMEPLQLVLPIKGIREFERALASSDGEKVDMLIDDTQVFFRFSWGEFAVRRMDVRFPPYERHMLDTGTTTMVAKRSELLEALERVDIVARDGTRVVLLDVRDGRCRMLGFSKNVGIARESVEAKTEGEPLRSAFNVRFLADGVKAFDEEHLRLLFNGERGQLTILPPTEGDYSYVIMPVALSDDEREELANAEQFGEGELFVGGENAG